MEHHPVVIATFGDGLGHFSDFLSQGYILISLGRKMAYESPMSVMIFSAKRIIACFLWNKGLVCMEKHKAKTSR